MQRMNFGLYAVDDPKQRTAGHDQDAIGPVRDAVKLKYVQTAAEQDKHSNAREGQRGSFVAAAKSVSASEKSG